ncbi:hypothetical protein [Acinetobacter pittii]|uniref:hypothetical protein n=1 Tax=Acinetobacter pittii TaxID=48296 RepID=UPI0013D89DA9|nr:hypothetical protein [Acinetobacter pittii]
MPKYFLLAEKINKNIRNKNSNNQFKNLNNLIVEIKKAIVGTELKFLYNFVNFEGTVISVKNELPIRLDMSLTPRHKSEDDFILWLADFIDRITIDTSKNLP